ncbi:hypothetical protein [Caldimonas thermodepolymerans]|uniref:Uncharacterized protein n=1 Tax=Caldimonas thermodepolymerans TaxID=215580 RepID=A0AA46HV80_9BURK|nr:hypothetical protein [Caldimonas thermodepolymerans]TCP06554.1 hypothetical protein EV676_10637 [Caldimonas thermodepolymerans]UZG49389.1 hypothetical protein ONS87_07145 [Caldimonas thermodepolymerans]
MIPRTITPQTLLMAAAVAAAAGFGAGWTANGLRLGAVVAACRIETAECRVDMASRDAQAAERTLEQLVDAAAAVSDAASAAIDATGRAAAATDAARRRWEQLVKATPLPVDCRPDQARAEAFSAAVRRAQETMR